LQPGEQLKVSPSRISREKVNSDLYSGWKDGIFRFNHTGIDEIAALLTDYYGFKVIVEGREDLRDKAISGEVSAKDIDALFNAIDVIMGLEVLKQDHTVIIRDK
ncbi:MAG TPA: FecR domain-containing protein, partial [Anseongella sp.]|nr:FecR domain-containing protein [Anseongella sp.]